MQFYSILEESLSNIFNNNFGIALKVAFVWVLSLFRYLISLFILQRNWNYYLPVRYQNNSWSRKGEIFSVTINAVFVSFWDRHPPGFQVLQENCKYLLPDISSTFYWNLSLQIWIYDIDFIPLNTKYPSSM